MPRSASIPNTARVTSPWLIFRVSCQVFRMAPCAVSDVPLSPDEAQIFECLGSLSHDVHPDAHACRLKIALETRGTAHGAAAASRMWVRGKRARPAPARPDLAVDSRLPNLAGAPRRVRGVRAKVRRGECSMPS